MNLLESFMDNAISVTVGIVITGALGYITSLIKKEQKERAEQRKDNEKQEKALSALLHDRLYQACQFYIMTNQIELEELDNLRHMFEPYAALGGNGLCKKLYERCIELPIVEKRTKWHQSYQEKGEKNEN